MVTCDITYRGIPATGVTFTVKGAHIKQSFVDGVITSSLMYQTEVGTPDGSTLSLPEWQNRKAQSVSFTSSPLEQAQADVVQVLTASGATNIVES